LGNAAVRTERRGRRTGRDSFAPQGQAHRYSGNMKTPSSRPLNISAPTGNSKLLASGGTPLGTKGVAAGGAQAELEEAVRFLALTYLANGEKYR
jgi:hypothetical protein